MNAWVGWALAVLAIAVGYVQYGWRGVVLGVTVVVFWLLLQFGKAMRVMRTAAAAPVGVVGSAVMLHAKLRRGMRLIEILPLTRSLGRKVADDPETFEWRDASGAAVRVQLQRGRCTDWTLSRADGEAPAP
ncbi:MAG: hypothetical protein ACLGIT_00155 [Gammaproteobacteria bacterium]|uniref:hypothetical protein n=1 Tax=Azohydromonas sp. TaxID=1872666 RepID=UPI002C416056|nr:hypothetical protein [Azohydromonas sp.]HMM87480.1 hypothetical protein [Azohydromonas sp.]